MYKIKTVLRTSKSNNLYLALTAFNNGVKVANVCLFEGKPFQAYSKYVSKGEANLVSKWANSFSETEPDATNIDQEKHTEELTTIGNFNIAFTDIATVGGVSTGSDGAFIILDANAYRIPTDKYIEV